MFINDQYYFNMSMDWVYVDTMEYLYFSQDIQDSDTLWVLMKGA